MEIITKSIFAYFDTQKVVLQESDVICEYTSIFKKRTEKYRFKDIGRTKEGLGYEHRYGRLGYFLLLLIPIVAIVAGISDNSLIKGIISILLLLCIVFALISFRLEMKKHKWISFFDKSDKFLFAMRLDKPEEREFAEIFKRRISATKDVDSNKNKNVEY